MQLRMEPKDGYLLAALSGKVSLEEAISTIGTVLAACREQAVNRILVDVRGVDGSSSVLDRYFLGTHFAQSEMQRVRTAMVCREDQWMADRPLENTAVNRGANFKATRSLDEALEWLGAAGTPVAGGG